MSPDDRLPGLDLVADPTRLKPLLEEAIRGNVERVDVRMLKYKPGRRCTFRYDLRLADGQTRSVIGKIYYNDRGEGVYRRMVALCHSAVADGIVLPRPLVYFADLRFLVQEALSGRSIHAESRFLEETGFLRACGAALALLHRADVALDKTYTLADERKRWGAWADDLASCQPELKAPVAARLASLHAWADRLPEVPLSVGHRDFYHDHVLDVDGKIGFIDLDELCLADPATDVGNFVAHLELLSLQRHGQPGVYRQPAAAFVDGYFRAGGPALPERIAFHRAATLFRLANLWSARPGWEWLAAPLLTA